MGESFLKILTQLKGKQINKNWYPQKLKVDDKGTASTYKFIEKVFDSKESIKYAEFGIYKGATALKVHELFPNSEIHLFDFEKTLNAFKKNVPIIDNRIRYFSNTQKYNDSYNWSLIKLIEERNNKPLFDYCFFDGAHTVAIDALNFFLADKLLKVGGYVDFDDYNWKIRGSSLDPDLVPEIAVQYTDEQIDSQQVKMIVDLLVKTDNRYKEIVPNKIFKKISN